MLLSKKYVVVGARREKIPCGIRLFCDCRFLQRKMKIFFKKHLTKSILRGILVAVIKRSSASTLPHSEQRSIFFPLINGEKSVSNTEECAESVGSAFFYAEKKVCY